MLAIIAAIEQEVTKDNQFPFRWEPDKSFGADVRAWRARRHRDTVLFLSGVGKDAARQAVGKILARERPLAIVSTGFAGALDPGFRSGDMVVATGLKSPEKPSEIKPHRNLRLFAQEAAGAQRLIVREGMWVTVERAVATTDEKRRLGEQMRAVAVDMESYWIAEAAQQAGIPFVGARAVADELKTDLPVMLRDVREQPSAMKVLGSALRKPGAIVPLVGLWRGSNKARRSLSLFTFEFIEQFSQRSIQATAGG